MRPGQQMCDQSMVSRGSASCGPACLECTSPEASCYAKKPTRTSSRMRLVLTIALLVVASNQMVVTNAFSRTDLDNNHIISSRQLRYAFKRSATIPSPASRPLAASKIKADVGSENKEAKCPSLPPTRNWRICTKSVVKGLSDPSFTNRPVTSPFEESSVIGREGEDRPPGTSSEAWSADAYTSALNLYDRLMGYCDQHKDDRNTTENVNLPHLVMSALDILQQSYRLYGPQSIIGSYNGGKDACVILHLMRAAYANYIREHPSLKDVACQPKTIYFEHEDEFPEVLDLLHESVVKYDLNMVAFDKGIKFADGLSSVVATNYIGDKTENSRPFPMAFVLGTRKGDPNAGNQGAFAPSSSFMPPFMRVNPILMPEWTYADVWQFLRFFELRYCQLYDEGYTSLGTVKDTMPCPALKKDELDLCWEEDTGNTVDDCTGEYWPAYMLKDWDQERAGRTKKKNK